MYYKDEKGKVVKLTEIDANKFTIFAKDFIKKTIPEIIHLIEESRVQII